MIGASVEASGYQYTDFETVRAQTVTLGPTRLYDDGVVLAFTSKDGNGIDLCSGPNGWRVATIDFDALDTNANGQRFSAGNQGWFATLTALGNRHYQVRVFDGSGQLQNDAFTFIR